MELWIIWHPLWTCGNEISIADVSVGVGVDVISRKLFNTHVLIIVHHVLIILKIY